MSVTDAMVRAADEAMLGRRADSLVARRETLRIGLEAALATAVAAGERREAAKWRELMERDTGNAAKHERLRITAQRAVEDWLEERPR